MTETRQTAVVGSLYVRLCRAIIGCPRGPLQFVILAHRTCSQHHQKPAGVQETIDTADAVKSA